jgi:ABC-type transport system substrate-binding protein
VQKSYWNRVLEGRISRRRAIATTGAFGAAAAFLAACGGDDDNGGSGSTGPKDSSGLLANIPDETKSAKKGGVYVDSHPGVILTHDPMKTGINIRGARRGFSQLFRVAPGFQQGPDGTIEGDLAQSWEMSPDNLTLTVKLEPEAGFAPVAPVNGRKVDAQDVIFSWERLQREGANRMDLVNAQNAGAPITSITAPDAKTVVIKMSEPNATILSLLGTEVLGTMYILAKEGADTSVLDIPRKAIGTGPYYLTEDSEVKYAWKKNPNFKRSKLTDGEPFIDEIHEPVIPDIAAATAQFTTGAIYEYGVQQLEVVATKRDVPQLLMRTLDPYITGTERLYLGQNEGSPFRDERVRIAYMKTIDRDAFIDAADNTDKFEAEGLPAQRYWDASIARGVWEGWWLDPKDEKSFGPNAKNYLYDLAEAKKLVEAAGYKTPLEFDEVYAAPGPSAFPASFYTRADIFLGQIEGSGVFQMSRKLINYQTEYNTDQYRFSRGKFTGATWGPDTASADPTSAVFFLFNSAGGYFEGGDATLDDLTNKARREFDMAKRKEFVQEVQRYHGGKFFNNKIGQGTRFALHWPAVRNVGVHRGGTNWLCVTTSSGLRAWIDPEQAPLKKA